MIARAEVDHGALPAREGGRGVGLLVAVAGDDEGSAGAEASADERELEGRELLGLVDGHDVVAPWKRGLASPARRPQAIELEEHRVVLDVDRAGGLRPGPRVERAAVERDEPPPVGHVRKLLFGGHHELEVRALQRVLHGEGREAALAGHTLDERPVPEEVLEVSARRQRPRANGGQVAIVVHEGGRVRRELLERAPQRRVPLQPHHRGRRRLALAGQPSERSLRLGSGEAIVGEHGRVHAHAEEDRLHRPREPLARHDDHRAKVGRGAAIKVSQAMKEHGGLPVARFTEDDERPPRWRSDRGALSAVERAEAGESGAVLSPQARRPRLEDEGHVASGAEAAERRELPTRRRFRDD